jgi:hypothetical protein
MRVLIFASPRSGSTSLTKALSKLLKVRRYLEPFNPLNISNLTEQEIVGLKYKLPKSCIVKVLAKSRSRDYYLDYIAYFDKVIFLTREDISAAYESYYRSILLHDSQLKKAVWHQTYMFDSSAHKIDKPIYNHVKSCIEEVKLVASLNNKSYIIYEELYSDNLDIFNKAFKALDINIDKEELRFRLNPKNKYRQTYKPNTII